MANAASANIRAAPVIVVAMARGLWRLTAALVVLVPLSYLAYEVLATVIPAFEIQNSLAILSPGPSLDQFASDIKAQDDQNTELATHGNLGADDPGQQKFAAPLRETAVQISELTTRLHDSLPGQYWPNMPTLISGDEDADLPHFDFDDDVANYIDTVAGDLSGRALDTATRQNILLLIGRIKSAVVVFTTQKNQNGWRPQYESDVGAQAFQQQVPKEGKYADLEERKKVKGYKAVMDAAMQFRETFEPGFMWMWSAVFVLHFVLASLLAVLASLLGTAIYVLLSLKSSGGQKADGGFYLQFALGALLAIAAVVVTFAGAFLANMPALSAYIFMLIGFIAGFVPDQVVSWLQQKAAKTLAVEGPAKDGD